MSAFPKFQMNLDYDTGMFTLRAEGWDEFVENLTVAAGEETAEALILKIKGGFEHLMDVPPRTRSEAQANLKAGGINTTLVEDVEYNLCPGHKEPMALRNGKKGKFWSCTAKITSGPNKGDFAWKHGEGCKPVDFEDGDEKYTPQNA